MEMQSHFYPHSEMGILYMLSERAKTSSTHLDPQKSCMMLDIAFRFLSSLTLIPGDWAQLRVSCTARRKGLGFDQLPFSGWESVQKSA